MNKLEESEIGIALLKGSIGAIPFVGTAINEMLFEVRGRVKQNRINNFVKAFADFIQKFDSNKLKLEQIKDEDFGDFFEEFLRNISKTRSETKILAFRNLLINQFLNPIPIDKTELIMNIVSSLHEKQILILSMIKVNYEFGYPECKGEKLIKERNLLELENQIQEKYGFMKFDDISGNRDFEELLGKTNKLKNEIKKLEKDIESLEEPFLAETYELSQSDFFYLKQDLTNKALLIDKGMQYSGEPLELIEISQLGIELIELIKDIK